MSATRMYLVVSDFGSKHLVEASTPAAAVHKIVKSIFTVTLPNSLELVNLMREGVPVVSKAEDAPLLDDPLPR